MEENALQQAKQRSLFDRVVLWVVGVCVIIIYIGVATGLLYGSNTDKIWGGILLLALLFFVGFRFNIKPIISVFNLLIKLLKPLIVAMFAIKALVIKSIRNAYKAVVVLLILLSFFAIAIVIFAIIKWAIGYVF